MNAAQYLEKHGREHTEKVCLVAKTTIVYFLQAVEGKRTFSRKLAERLELASNGEMDRVSLVFGSNPPPPVEVAVAAQDGGAAQGDDSHAAP